MIYLIITRRNTKVYTKYTTATIQLLPDKIYGYIQRIQLVSIVFVIEIGVYTKDDMYRLYSFAQRI